jgi:hypothetical protein
MGADTPDYLVQLNLLQAQLASAQKKEVQALRAVSEHIQKNGDKTTLRALEREALQAQDATNELLSEWKKVSSRFFYGPREPTP